MSLMGGSGQPCQPAASHWERWWLGVPGPLPFPWTLKRVQVGWEWMEGPLFRADSGFASHAAPGAKPASVGEATPPLLRLHPVASALREFLLRPLGRGLWATCRSELPFRSSSLRGGGGFWRRTRPKDTEHQGQGGWGPWPLLWVTCAVPHCPAPWFHGCTCLNWGSCTLMRAVC